MRTLTRGLAIVTALYRAASLFFPHRAAANSQSDVQNSLSELTTWLGQGANGKVWANYLNLASLKTELAKGDDADPAVVSATQKQFKSGAAGLDRPQFVKLRDALALWQEELVLAKEPSLSDAVLKQQASFRPVSDADLMASKAALAAATAKLDRYLGTGGKNGTAWKSYLRFGDLESQLHAATPDPEALGHVEEQFGSDKTGLEMPIFADVRSELDRYINDLAARQADVPGKYADQLKQLAEELKKYPEGFSDEVANSLGGRLGWLSDMRQNRALVDVIRSRFSRPNLLVRMSSRLVGAGIEQPLDENTPVRDNILGTDISGTGHTVGRITMQLLPDNNAALLETLLVGTTTTRTVGFNGPATIYSDGTTQIRGSKRMVIDQAGLASYPATATATTQTQITGVAARCGLVQRIATKKVYQSKSQAEQIGSSHAAARVRERVEEQATGQLNKAQGEYFYKVRYPLLRRREFPPLLKFNTTSESLFITVLQANRNQIAAPSAPPKATAEQHDLAVQMHESLINNFASAMLSGVHMKEEDLQKQVVELRGSLPKQLESDEGRDPWSITFAKVRPVTVRFLENAVQITVRGTRYTSGEREFRGMNVTADYKIEQQGAGVRLVRQEDLTIVPPNYTAGQRLSTQQVALKTLLQRKFGKLFEPEIKGEGLVLPGRWRSAGRLDMKQLQSGGGWLALAWIESGVPAPPEEPKPPANPAAVKNKVAQR